MLLGEAQATVDVASEAVLRMSGSRREREAPPSTETVHHIVKAEVCALETKVGALVKAELDTKVDALQDEVRALGGKFDSLNAKLDRLLNSTAHAYSTTSPAQHQSLLPQRRCGGGVTHHSTS